MLAYRCGIMQLAQYPFTGRASIGKRFCRGECFGANNEKCFLRIDISCRFLEIRAIHVGHKAEPHVAHAIISQRFVSHYGTEIGTPNSDIDDIAYRLAGMPSPEPAADLISKSRHAIKYRLHLGYHITSPDNDPFTFGGS